MRLMDHPPNLFAQQCNIIQMQVSESNPTCPLGLTKLQPCYHRPSMVSNSPQPPGAKEHGERYLCAWGNDAASEVITEARLLLVENYFQTPSSAWLTPGLREFLEGLPPGLVNDKACAGKSPKMSIARVMQHLPIGSLRMFWLVSVAAALWVLWCARNDKIFNQKDASTKSCIFQAKLISLIWLKTSNGKKVGELDGWWYSPKNLGTLKFESKRTAECTYKFTVVVVVIRRGWGIGGVLLTGKCDIRSIFSRPSLCCSMVVAEIEAINLAQLIFIEAGHSIKASLADEIGVGYRGDFVKVEIALCAGSDFLSLLH
ncbi:hypothetical protein V6N11_048859 [Hibiscus sabdariffa]|uniref:RNase H type-1 domain-containing protein n=1 Tax=Hibiscus sabdariffa TaxID=183260 RepID=A0ABR2PWK8_9ROSI